MLTNADGICIMDIESFLIVGETGSDAKFIFLASIKDEMSASFINDTKPDFLWR